MGFLRNLLDGWANMIRPSQFEAWADAISDEVESLAGGGAGTQAQTRYVSVAGNDTTGDGTFGQPFLTIARAMTSITDANATTKPYVVDVGPGIFPTPFTVKSGVYVIGKGTGSGEYNGGPLMGVTSVTPAAAQVLDNASFAGAGNNSGGILGCVLTAALAVNFATAASSNGTFYIGNIFSQSDVVFTGFGNGGTNYVRVNNLNITGFAAADLRFINMGGSTVSTYLNDFGGNLVYTQSAAIQGFHVTDSLNCGEIQIAWTSALITNFMSVAINGSNIFDVVVSGAGAIVFQPSQSLVQTMPDANARLAFGTDAAATLVGLNAALNVIEGTPTANRTLTIVRPSALPVTTIIVRNLATATFNIDLVLVISGTITAAPGNPTYVPPGGEVTIHMDAIGAPVGNRWLVTPYVQRGTVTLVAGVSAAIPADITARSAITVTPKVFAGAAGVAAALQADRVVGTRAGGGSFLVKSIAQATGAVVATDGGTYDWEVAG